LWSSTEIIAALAETSSKPHDLFTGDEDKGSTNLSAESEV
jgi:hypothetical protein